MLKCAHCGEVAVDDTENEAVCHACGVVAQEIKFSTADLTSAPPQSYSRFTRFEAQLYQKKKPSVSEAHGLSIIDHLCLMNNATSYFKQMVVGLFKNICAVRRFKRKEDAGATAACCFFLLQRKHLQAIPIKKVCDQAQCTKGKFSSFLNFVKSYLPLYEQQQKCPTLHVKKEDAKGLLSDVVISLIQEVCERADVKERIELRKKVTALVKLADDCWLLTGRSPKSVVVASTYLCWKSMNPLRRKASFPKFCAAFELKEPVAKLRIPELIAVLMKLGEKIPSFNPNFLDEKNLLFHLDTILENSESLRNDLLPDIHASEAVDCKEYAAFRFPSKTQPRKEPADSVSYDSDMNASDIEISDTEIESYLRSDSKQKVIELCEKTVIE